MLKGSWQSIAIHLFKFLFNMYMCMYMWLCDTEITVSASNSLINLHVLAADLMCILRKRLTSYVPVGMCAYGGKKTSQVLLERGDYNAVHIPSGICRSNTYWPEAVMFQAAQHGFLPAVSWHSLGQHEAPWRVAGSHCLGVEIQRLVIEDKDILQLAFWSHEIHRLIYSIIAFR